MSVSGTSLHAQRVETQNMIDAPVYALDLVDWSGQASWAWLMTGMEIEKTENADEHDPHSSCFPAVGRFWLCDRITGDVYALTPLMPARGTSPAADQWHAYGWRVVEAPTATDANAKAHLSKKVMGGGDVLTITVHPPWRPCLCINTISNTMLSTVFDHADLAASMMQECSSTMATAEDYRVTVRWSRGHRGCYIEETYRVSQPPFEESATQATMPFSAPPTCGSSTLPPTAEMSEATLDNLQSNEDEKEEDVAGMISWISREILLTA